MDSLETLEYIRSDDENKKEGKVNDLFRILRHWYGYAGDYFERLGKKQSL